MTEVLSWPYPTIVDNRNAGIDIWVEITEEAYWHFLEVLPPICFDGRNFCCSEPYSHDLDTDEATYAGFRVQDGRYFSKLVTRKEFIEELRMPIDIDNRPLNIQT